jgi:ParB/RepB/Spo0J family partition protein
MSQDYVVHHLPLDEVFADADFNCRGFIQAVDVVDLANDIKAKGLDQPIIVQPYSDPTKPQYKYKVVVGHRREKAFRYNQEKTIPAYIRTNLSEVEARTLNLRENLHRVDLNVKQEAHALKYFMNVKNDKGYQLFTDADLGTLFGKSRGWVQNRRDLLKLPEDIQNEAAAGMLNAEQIKTLARISSREQLYEAVRKIKTAKLNGDKITVTKSVKKHTDVLRPKEREKGEVLEMNGMLYDLMGPSVLTRYGAWMAGEISTAAFLASVESHCKEIGKKFVMPQFVNNALLGVKTEGHQEVIIGSTNANTASQIAAGAVAEALAHD